MDHNIDAYHPRKQLNARRIHWFATIWGAAPE